MPNLAPGALVEGLDEVPEISVRLEGCRSGRLLVTLSTAPTVVPTFATECCIVRSEAARFGDAGDCA